MAIDIHRYGRRNGPIPGAARPLAHCRGGGTGRLYAPGGHARVLWLLPITAAEKAFRHRHGLEALEQRFETAGIIPADPARGSVVG